VQKPDFVGKTAFWGVIALDVFALAANGAKKSLFFRFLHRCSVALPTGAAALQQRGSKGAPRRRERNATAGDEIAGRSPLRIRSSTPCDDDHDDDHDHDDERGRSPPPAGLPHSSANAPLVCGMAAPQRHGGQWQRHQRNVAGRTYGAAASGQLRATPIKVDRKNAGCAQHPALRQRQRHQLRPVAHCDGNDGSDGTNTSQQLRQ
jgi:hypothetical protein